MNVKVHVLVFCAFCFIASNASAEPVFGSLRKNIKDFFAPVDRVSQGLNASESADNKHVKEGGDHHKSHEDEKVSNKHLDDDDEDDGYEEDHHKKEKQHDKDSSNPPFSSMSEMSSSRKPSMNGDFKETSGDSLSFLTNKTNGWMSSLFSSDNKEANSSSSPSNETSVTTLSPMSSNQTEISNQTGVANHTEAMYNASTAGLIEMIMKSTGSPMQSHGETHDQLSSSSEIFPSIQGTWSRIKDNLTGLTGESDHDSGKSGHDSGKPDHDSGKSGQESGHPGRDIHLETKETKGESSAVEEKDSSHSHNRTQPAKDGQTGSASSAVKSIALVPFLLSIVVTRL